MSDLLSKAEYACKIAMQNGADVADVFVQKSRNAGVEIDKSSIKACNIINDFGISVRSYKNGGMGFSFTMSLDEKSIKEIAETSVTLAKHAQPDPDFVDLPESEKAKEIEGLFDENILNLDAGKIVEWAIMAINEAKEVFDNVIVNGGVGFSYEEHALVSSKGVAIEGKSTSVGMSTFSIIKKGDDIGSFFEFDSARVLKDFNPIGIGKKSASEAKKFLGGRKIKTCVVPIVLGPLASSSIIGTIAGNVNAEGIQRKRSFLIGKLGEKISNELLTIVDEPLIPCGLGSSNYDGEGVPRKKITIVEKGVLKTYLHNSYTANKGKTENTGHAARFGYRSGVGISPTNVNPIPGNILSTDIIKDTKYGIYINEGSIAPHPVTGDISASVDFGFLVENGELTYPIINTMVGSNIFEILNNIDAISSDYRAEPGTIMPTIRIQNVKVAGGE